MAAFLSPSWLFILVASWRLLVFSVCMLVWIIWTLGQLQGDVACCAGTAPRIGRPSPGDRPLVVFAYAESEVARTNLEFFIKKGVHRRADFVFVFNGPTDATEMIPRLPNVWQVRRNNTCFDIGAIGEVLRIDGLWRRYKRFITMNASIRGPFLPVYSNACWSDLFLNRLNDHTKLVGMTMNCIPRPHVQSMLWATDSVSMSILQDPLLANKTGHEDIYGAADDPVGMSGCYNTWDAAVHAEIGTTELVTSQGYAVDAMMTAFHGTQGTEAYCEANLGPPDPFFDKQYFGANVHPYETVFMKANRDIEPVLLERLTTWNKNRNFNAWNACGPDEHQSKGWW